MNNHEYQKTCPECKKDFTAFRLDQVYCSRHCLNRTKNRQARHKRRQVSPIDKLLHRNRAILQELTAKRKDGIVSREELLFRDFNFHFHTHTLKDPDSGMTYFFLYEYGFAQMEDQRYKLVHHDPKI